jgi:hypothetical protein
MSFVTGEPVALVSANRWVIGDIYIDPRAQSVSYQVIAFNGAEEVRRVTVSEQGAALEAREGVAELYAQIMAMLSADAITRGLIPQAAQEEQQ